MNPLLSAISRYIRRPNRSRGRMRKSHRDARRQRLCLEVLEDRVVLSPTISIANATMNEIGQPSAFISAGSGGLNTPWGITLGPDGTVYVAGNNGAVLRYNGTTGAYINTFVAQGSGGWHRCRRHQLHGHQRHAHLQPRRHHRDDRRSDSRQQ